MFSLSKELLLLEVNSSSAQMERCGHLNSIVHV